MIPPYPNQKTKSVAQMLTSKSQFVPGRLGIGEMLALTPRIKRILKILDPMIFPRAMSVFFLYAAIAEVASSGSEVPTAIIVSPMILSLIPRVFAIHTAPLIIHSPQRTSPANPRIIQVIPFQRGMGTEVSCVSSSGACLMLW